MVTFARQYCVKPQENGKLFNSIKAIKMSVKTILHLILCQCAEVSATKREGVFHAIKVWIEDIQMISVKDSIEAFSNILAGLLFVHRHNIGVQEIVLP
jgi:hypothetical protein